MIQRFALAFVLALASCGEDSTADRKPIKPPTGTTGVKPKSGGVSFKCDGCQKTQTPIDSAGAGPSC